ncbi:MAG TPA: cysteine--tRNA ligase [Bacteroidia bacterium]|nr:cysteine--tRNA ligase [Bacteroidia bacterium]
MSNNTLQVYNTLTRKKEIFAPLDPPFVGMYLCGPTVYGDAHLGHARPAITFDILFRYLKYLGYKVRYVRNITDVGHLENDADEGEDKIEKKARLEKLEPMEVVQHYTLGYHRNMHSLNVIPPSIEPHASGHIIEQIEMIKTILAHGFAYESNGSVYFDIGSYEKKHKYGQLSGRITEDLLHNTRELDGQSEKRSPIDFALWKKASPEHIMHWPSPWGEGFPGWHIECSAMSKKYLGETFDIHGGGMDLLFPHHECEIAQSIGSSGKQPVRYWMHNNMLTINGQKMGKSLNNFINLDKLFTGKHKLLEQAYTPMTLRFCMLQSHYRNPIDFSNKGLQDAEKGLTKLTETYFLLRDMKWTDSSVNAETEKELSSFEQECTDAMNDDLNTAIVISHMFQTSAHVNRFHASGKTEGVSEKAFESYRKAFMTYFTDILGLVAEEKHTSNEDFDNLVNTLIEARTEAKKKKDFTLSDTIRNILSKFVVLQDSATTTVWKHERKK